MRAMELGVVAWLTDRGVGIAELAAAVEQAGLESLFLTEHTHVPVSRVIFSTMRSIARTRGFWISSPCWVPLPRSPHG